MSKLTDTLVLASGNKGKLREFQQIFSALDIQVVPQSDFAVGDVEETGHSFVENAIIKARHASAISGLPVLADDSGLAVDALGGAPGIYSARFSGKNATDFSNNQQLLEQMQGIADEQRTASFHCVLVLMRHAADPVPMIFHGQWHGRILHQPAGENGFGYDPLFYVPDQQCSSAQLVPDVKNRISHRAQAVAQLVKAING